MTLLLGLLLLDPTAPAAAPPAETTPPLAYSQKIPVMDENAEAFLKAYPGQPFRCEFALRVDRFGEIRDIENLGCPWPLEHCARIALLQWRFHPATVGTVAVDAGQTRAAFVFVYAVALPDPPVQDGDLLVRMGPVASPLWPRPPAANAETRALMDAQGLASITCSIELSVDEKGQPASVVPVDCPEAMVEPVVRGLERYGITVSGARPGDPQRYRLSVVIPREGRPDAAPPPLP